MLPAAVDETRSSQTGHESIEHRIDKYPHESHPASRHASISHRRLEEAAAPEGTACPIPAAAPARFGPHVQGVHEGVAPPIHLTGTPPRHRRRLTRPQPCHPRNRRSSLFSFRGGEQPTSSLISSARLLHSGIRCVGLTSFVTGFDCSIMLTGRLSPAWPLISHIFISGDERNLRQQRNAHPLLSTIAGV